MVDSAADHRQLAGGQAIPGGARVRWGMWWSAIGAAVQVWRRPTPERLAEMEAERRRARMRLDVERVRRVQPESWPPLPAGVDGQDGDGGDSSTSARSR